MAAIILALGGAALWLQFGHGYTPKINGADSVASLEQVQLGRFKQWILIRGAHRSSPILLFLHGGPGMPMMYLEHAFGHDLEQHFVVVEWDRLGAGKSYHPGIPASAMRVTREIADTHQLIELLCARFGKKKVYLVGHSYGSYLGMLVAARYPNLIAAYVGVGQVTDPQRASEVQDHFFRREAKASDNKKLLDELDHHKPIDREHWLFEYHAELYHSTSWLPLLWTGLLAPEYKLTDALDIPRGVSFTHKYLKYDAIDGPLTENVKTLGIPVYFFLGRHDYTTPSNLAVAYMKELRAPRKQVVWFEHSAHFPFLEEPKKFAAEMLQVYDQTSSGLTTRSTGRSPAARVRAGYLKRWASNAESLATMSHFQIATGLFLLFVGGTCSGTCLVAQSVCIPSSSICTSSVSSFVGPCKSLRARLQRGADTISVWIWPVGTKRYLGYPDWAPCRLPPQVARRLTLSNVLYANIVVRPMSKQKPKHMQFVCVASASHIVVRATQY